jgi:hypothetical protein
MPLLRSCSTALCAVLLLLAGPQVSAQTVQCVNPRPTADGRCVLTLDRDPAPQHLIVHVVPPPASPRSGIRVVFSDPGSGTWTTRTDTLGRAMIPWQRNLTTDSAIVDVEAHFSDEHSAIRQIVVRPAAAARSNLVIGRMPGDSGEPRWYAQRQIRYPMRVLITGTTPATCPDTRVVFRAIGGGAATPDTISPRWLDPNQCIAETYWRLGETIGKQHLVASLARDRTMSTTFQASARPLPRFVVGAGADWRSHFFVLETDSVTRVDSVTGIPSVVARDTVVRREGEIRPHTVFGVDFAPLAKVDRLRMLVGVALTDPARQFTLGLSAPQLLGFGGEGFPLDLHFTSRWSRVERLDNPGACRFDRNDCATTESIRFEGFGGVVTFDGGTFFSELIKSLGKL